MSDFSGQREGEEVQFVFRRHIFETRRGLFFCILCNIIGVLPLIFWHDSRAFWIWFSCFIVGILCFVYVFMLWHFSVYVVTNQRIRQISQRGLFRRTVIDLGLDKIQSLSYNVPSLFGGIFNYGTLLIQTQVGDLEITMVSHPEQTYNNIQNLLGELEN